MTIISRKAHKNNKRVWRVNINGVYRWFDNIAQTYKHTLPHIKAKRACRNCLV